MSYLLRQAVANFRPNCISAQIATDQQKIRKITIARHNFNIFSKENGVHSQQLSLRTKISCDSLG